MVNLRNITGKESVNYWQERYGTQAGESHIVSRIGSYSSFGSAGSYGYNICKSSHTDHNLLVHSIRVIQTEDDDDVIMAIYDNSVAVTTVTDAVTILKFVVNRKGKRNNTTTMEFPIPLFLQSGGRIRETSTEHGPIVQICYTVLDSKGAIPNQEFMYLRAAQQWTTAAEQTVVSDTDVEVYGAYLCSTATDDPMYASCNIRDGAGSGCGVMSVNETFADTGTGADLWWFPYPLYLKDGLKLENSGYNNSDETPADRGAYYLYSTVFYRKVNAKGVDYDWF